MPAMPRVMPAASAQGVGFLSFRTSVRLSGGVQFIVLVALVCDRAHGRSRTGNAAIGSTKQSLHATMLRGLCIKPLWPAVLQVFDVDRFCRALVEGGVNRLHSFGPAGFDALPNGVECGIDLDELGFSNPGANECW